MRADLAGLNHLTLDHAVRRARGWPWPSAQRTTVCRDGSFRFDRDAALLPRISHDGWHVLVIYPPIPGDEREQIVRVDPAHIILNDTRELMVAVIVAVWNRIVPTLILEVA